ncbi:MAG: hypothetical protein M1823_000950 [Watsoniomyces obsoletus]|nr:MAG: hypothetical protein M1823_000950 [Watsoniomyces obsoletus]
MHKISSTFSGSARSGWEKMTPAAFGMSRPTPGPTPDGMNGTAVKRSLPVGPQLPGSYADNVLHLSFNVPFSSNLAGPDGDDTLHATPGAVDRWLHPEGTPDGTPTYQLPVHTQNLDALKHLCRQMSEVDFHSRKVEAAVTSSEPKPIPALQQRRPLKGLVTNVCLSGDVETVHRMRGRILHETPLALKCATVHVDNSLVIDSAADAVKAGVLEHLDTVAAFTGTDIFLLGPGPSDADTIGTTFNYSPEISLNQRLRVVIYGDNESVEHAKTRVLIMIDQILKRTVDVIKLESSAMHPLLGGRCRRNIKLIEAATGAAIYFPPPFPRAYGYTPPGAHRRGEDEVFITGPTTQSIIQAKQRLHELVSSLLGQMHFASNHHHQVMSTKCYVKDVALSSDKIDCILLDRLDKVRRITESTGSCVIFPPLGSRRGRIRVQGTEILHVERTVREVMALAGQFYTASWWILLPDPASGTSVRAPTASDVRTMLSDICTNSGADVSFEKLTFNIYGSDDAVKAAMMVIEKIPFVKRAQYQIKVQMELGSEHKEFVSGKKNGKINKIMGQSDVQIIFDGCNEYNLYIDVCGSRYDAVNNGLDLVEQEMPASISFHVPDQYHKRIIGIGGQHIQRIMKKYSVFVKFSNAMDRGVGREEDDLKVDNVICRTPARNAQNLDLVKQEIMDMVEKSDAEFVQETVIINRLYHRELISRMDELEELEKKWNCKIIFPSTETASDVVTISGPEYQVPQAVDEFLSMVPESNEIVLPSSPELSEFLKSDQFRSEVQHKLKTQYEVDLQVGQKQQQDGKRLSTPTTDKHPGPMESLLFMYTRNNAGGLKDAADFLIARLVAHGLDVTTVKASVPRPKSDSFEDNLPFFDSKILQNAPAPVVTQSTIKPTPVEESSERSIFDRLRKPGSISSISSFLERRKNHHQSNSASSIFRNGSSNCSKASLVSIESQSSSYRNPWNDSGVNLVDEDHHHHGPHHPHHAGHQQQHGQNGHQGPGGQGSHQQVQGQQQQTTMFNSTNAAWSVRQNATKMTSPTGPGMMGQNMSMGMGMNMNMTPISAGGVGGTTGENTPRYDVRTSFDSGRPSTSHSMMGGNVNGIGNVNHYGNGNGVINGNGNGNGMINGAGNGTGTGTGMGNGNVNGTAMNMNMNMNTHGTGNGNGNTNGNANGNGYGMPPPPPSSSMGGGGSGGAGGR